MKNIDLQKISNQIEKYNLTECFYIEEELEEWLNNLSRKEIKNLISLEVNPEEIMFPKRILINENLLKSSDYNKRVEAMSKLKNGDGWWHLFDSLCSPNFLKSKNYYKDIEKISKAETAKYALWVIDDDNFINSPYHNGDLELITSAKDEIISELLATIAQSKASIKSIYHRYDMNLILNTENSKLQYICSYPHHCINMLATNEVSLKDPYHIENMQILLNNEKNSVYLYRLMTNEKVVNDKNYRKEIDIVSKAKSEKTAKAMYYYIVDPKKCSNENFYDDYIGFEQNRELHRLFLRKQNKSIKVNNNPKFLNYLESLNEIDDKYVFLFEALMSNKDVLKGNNLDIDLNILSSVTDEDIFVDLYEFMTDKTGIKSPYHIKDALMIKNNPDEVLRNTLIRIATNIDSIKSNNHEYDMNYANMLEYDNMSYEQIMKTNYYLLEPEGINHNKVLSKNKRGNG